MPDADPSFVGFVKQLSARLDALVNSGKPDRGLLAIYNPSQQTATPGEILLGVGSLVDAAGQPAGVVLQQKGTVSQSVSEYVQQPPDSPIDW